MKLTLKNTILIKRKKEDFTSNIFLPQRDINSLQLQKESLYMDLQHFLVSYFVLFCCWVVFYFFYILCLLVLLFWLFFCFCVWFLSQISNNLKLQKEMDHRAREDPLQNKTYYKKWAPKLLANFPLHHSLTSVTVISLRRVRNENEQQQNDRNKKKIFHGISFIYLCYFKRPPNYLHY